MFGFSIVTWAIYRYMGHKAVIVDEDHVIEVNDSPSRTDHTAANLYQGLESSVDGPEFPKQPNSQPKCKILRMIPEPRKGDDRRAAVDKELNALFKSARNGTETRRRRRRVQTAV